MNSRTTERFWKCYAELPIAIRKLVSPFGMDGVMVQAHPVTDLVKYFWVFGLDVGWVNPLHGSLSRHNALMLASDKTARKA